MKNRIANGMELERVSIEEPAKTGIWVWRLKGSERGTLIIYSPSFWGVRVHWDNRIRRSRPHFKDTALCDGCLKQLATKPLYYLHGEHVEKRKKVFLELPDGAAKHLNSMLAFGESFRGLGLLVQRSAADNGRLSFRFVEQKTPEKKLPRDMDPHNTLMAMWGIPTDDPRGGLEFPTSEPYILNGNGSK